MSFKNNFPFDRSQGRNRSVVGQADTAQQITSAAMLALMDKPQIDTEAIDSQQRL